MAHCLVTGGAGFIGSHLTDALIAEGNHVVVVDNLLLGKREFVNPKADFYEGDIRDEVLLAKLCEGVDLVFHLAADPRLPLSIEDPITTHDINVTGTLKVLEAARLSRVKKFVFTSSAAVYGDQDLMPIGEEVHLKPKSPYGLHKMIGEYYTRLYHELYDMETVTLRYFNVFGERKTTEGGYPMVIPIFIEQRKENKALTIVGDGQATRDYVHVSDVVRANIAAWESDVKDGTVINICSGVQTSVNEIAQLIGGETKQVPERKGEMRYIEGDNSRARALLNWQPKVTLEEGIEALKKEAGI